MEEADIDDMLLDFIGEKVYFFSFIILIVYIFVCYSNYIFL